MTTTTINHTNVDDNKNGSAYQSALKLEFQHAQADMVQRPRVGSNETINAFWTFKAPTAGNENQIIRFRANNNRSLQILQPDDASKPFIFHTSNAITFRIDAMNVLELDSGGNIKMPNLPNNSAGLPVGTIWRSGTNLRIVT